MKSALAAALVILAVAFLSLSNTQAVAQFKVELGGNQAEIKEKLIAQGYTRIDFVGRGFTKHRVEACRKGIRYNFKVDWRGKTNKMRKIGKCRMMITIEQVRDILRDRGYRRINLEDQSGSYVAVACAGSDRYRIEVNVYGDIRKERRLGRCRKELSPSDIEVNLKQQGYERIEFTDRQLPRYVALACRDRRKYELVINRHGEVRDSRDIGRCRRAIDPLKIPELLAAKGYDRIRVIDNQLPRYVADACKKKRRYEVTLNRMGRITDTVAIGRCQRPLSRFQLLSYMSEQGFSRVRIRAETGDSYDVEGCIDGDRYRFTLSVYGNLQDEKKMGKCTSKTTFDVFDQYRKQGFNQLTNTITGCKNGKKYRFQVNEFGDHLDTQTIGDCVRTLDAPHK